MLDISILSVDRYLSSEAKKQEFITNNCTIEQKSDGTKLSLFHINNTGDYTKDWIVSYKTYIQYPDEHEYASLNKIKAGSINSAQYKLVFDHLKKISEESKSLPLDMEFFIEYLMTKPTVSANYKNKHKMILIGYSKTNLTIKFGRVISKPKGLQTLKRDFYAKILKLNIPRVLFDGSLANFETGIKNKDLKSEYNQIKNQLNLGNTDDFLSKIKDLFLRIPSVYGGKEEGVIYKSGDLILKWSQDYQTDKTARAIIRNQYRGSDEEEQEYWKNVRNLALRIINSLPRPFNDNNLNKILQKGSLQLKNISLDFSHPKKTELQIKEDTQLTIKLIIIKNLKGNNNFLYLGKFRVLTIAHYNIIKQGLRDYDGGVICIVSNKDTIKTRELRTKMIKSSFPDIDILYSNTGNIHSILNQSEKNINVILAGSDRVQSYRALITNNPDLSVQEIKRTSSDISATAVIENIDNFLLFKRNTPKEIHYLYDEIKNTYTNKE